MNDKKMVCLIGHQPLPNFIPVNEPATRPAALYAIYTPQDAQLKQRWDWLKSVLGEVAPGLELIDVPLDDAYDPAGVQRCCEELLAKAPEADWSLNMTGGTKLMSLAAAETFRDQQRTVLYVDTVAGTTRILDARWSGPSLPFASSIDVKTYFSLFGKRVDIDTPQTGQEKALLDQLTLLDWQVWPSVRLFDGAAETSALAEFDAIGIDRYQLSAFECKRLNASAKEKFYSKNRVKQAKDDILRDLYKLQQVRQSFGGPFGRSYWVFSGKAELSNVNKSRMRDFQITMIHGGEIGQIRKEHERWGLPAPRGTR